MSGTIKGPLSATRELENAKLLVQQERELALTLIGTMTQATRSLRMMLHSLYLGAPRNTEYEKDVIATYQGASDLLVWLGNHEKEYREAVAHGRARTTNASETTEEIVLH